MAGISTRRCWSAECPGGRVRIHHGAYRQPSRQDQIAYRRTGIDDHQHDQRNPRHGIPDDDSVIHGVFDHVYDRIEAWRRYRPASDHAGANILWRSDRGDDRSSIHDDLDRPGGFDNHDHGAVRRILPSNGG